MEPVGNYFMKFCDFTGSSYDAGRNLFAISKFKMLFSLSTEKSCNKFHLITLCSGYKHYPKQNKGQYTKENY